MAITPNTGFKWLTSCSLAVLIFLMPLHQSEARKRTPLTKYYMYGLLPYSPILIDSVYARYHVRIINAGCVMDAKRMKENRQVDSMLRTVYHTDMPAILRLYGPRAAVY